MINISQKFHLVQVEDRVAGCVSNTSGTVLLTEDTLEVAEELFAKIAEKYKIPGGVLGIRSPDGTVDGFSYGYAELGETELMDVEHLFRVGSITKTFDSLVKPKIIVSKM